MRLRSMAPEASMKALPNCCAISGIAAPATPVSSWAMASVSTTLAPSSANASAAALLPLPMPPVSPTTRRIGSAGEIPAHDRSAPEHGDDRAECEVRAEVEAERAVPAALRGGHLQH